MLVRITLIILPLAILVGVALQVSPIANTKLVSQDNELADFYFSEGETAYLEAQADWPSCLPEKNSTKTECAKWNDDTIEFSLTAIESGATNFVPVVSSRNPQTVKSDRVVIHLTGGTDLPPFANQADPRSTAFRYFHDIGYTFVSIAYWGTSFRTSLRDGEIIDAADDFESVYYHYTRECECSPLIIGESLGAAIIFYYYSENIDFSDDFIFISPIVLGIDRAIKYYTDTMSESDLALTTRATRIYERYPEGNEVFLRRTLQPSLDHLRSFIKDYPTEAKSRLLQRKCPTFIVGIDDPLNRDFDLWELASVWGVKGGEHDLFTQHSKDLREAFKAALNCDGSNG